MDAAFAAAALMQRHGFQLGVRHHTMLINACARAKPPQVERAEAQFEELLLLSEHASRHWLHLGGCCRCSQERRCSRCCWVGVPDINFWGHSLCRGADSDRMLGFQSGRRCSGLWRRSRSCCSWACLTHG